MNIIEALREVKKGKIVRYEYDGRVLFFLEECILPYGRTYFGYLCLQRQDEIEGEITCLKDLKKIADQGWSFEPEEIESAVWKVVKEKELIAEFNKAKEVK